jgi:hypothetical protein
MKKQILLGLIILNLTNCAWKPIVDTKGRSGTHGSTQAESLSDDIKLCELIAEEHTNKAVEAGKGFYNFFIRPQTLWLSPEAKYDRETYMRTCLKNRGHSILN